MLAGRSPSATLSGILVWERAATPPDPFERRIPMLHRQERITRMRTTDLGPCYPLPTCRPRPASPYPHTCGGPFLSGGPGLLPELSPVQYGCNCALRRVS